MEHFFSAIATLMSNQLRGAVQKALNDFSNMLEVYCNGNSYTGKYERGLPTVNNAIVIGLVGSLVSLTVFHYISVYFVYCSVTDTLLQEPNQSSASVQFQPSFTDIAAALVNCLAIIVLSVDKIPRVERNLFMDKDAEE